jgi:hypothetical protein
LKTTLALTTKETNMQYKTMILQYLRQRPEIHNQLKSKRTLLPTLERWATELKTRHQTWKEQLSQAKPGSDPSQIASEALEFAFQELKDCLMPETRQRKNQPLSLDEVMAFIRREKPPA